MSLGGIIGAVGGALLGAAIVIGTMGWGAPVAAIVVGVSLGASVGTTIGLLVDPIRMDMPGPGEPEKFDMPKNQEGATITEILGTVPLAGYFVRYWGARTVETTAESGGKGGGGGGSQVTGYEYYLSWVWVLCKGPIDNVFSIQASNEYKDIKWRGKLDYSGNAGTDVSLLDMGTATIYMGGDNNIDSAVAGAFPTTACKYKGQALFIAKDLKIGKANRVPALQVVCRRIPISTIIDDASVNYFDYNAAAAVEYVMLSMCGLPTSVIDDFSFGSTACWCQQNGIGVSMSMNQQQSGASYIDTILQHFQGLLRWSNGKFYLTFMARLLLENPDPATRIAGTLTNQNITKLPTLSRGTWIDCISEVKVQYSRIVLINATNGEVTTPWLIGYAWQIQGLPEPEGIEIEYMENMTEQDIITMLEAGTHAVITKDALAGTFDMGVRMQSGRYNSKTVRLGLFSSEKPASWMARRIQKNESYPCAKMDVTVNRDLIRCQPGDMVGVYYIWPSGALINAYMRVMAVKEDGPDSEDIVLSLSEDPDVMGYDMDRPVGMDPYYNEGATLNPFVYQRAIEAPYIISGADVQIVTLATRVSGNEQGYNIYYSSDGVNYSLQGNSKFFNPSGTLVLNLPITDDIDWNGFQVDMEPRDIAYISSVNEVDIYGYTNMAVIGDEILTFRDFTPITATRYQLNQVTRGRFGTLQAEHAAGARMYFLGNGRMGVLNIDALSAGSTAYIKLQPYDARGSILVSQATAMTVNLTGEALAPYAPVNLEANGETVNATYSTDIVLAWVARLKEDGAGLEAISGQYPTGSRDYDGLFRVRVYNGMTLVHTENAINALTWTYSGGSASEYRIMVENYNTVSGVNYYSDPAEIIVRKI